MYLKKNWTPYMTQTNLVPDQKEMQIKMVSIKGKLSV